MEAVPVQWSAANSGPAVDRVNKGGTERRSWSATYGLVRGVKLRVRRAVTLLTSRRDFKSSLRAISVLGARDYDGFTKCFAEALRV